MSSIHVEGGARLSGDVVVSGSKNAALPIMAAALLTDEPLILENVPDIEDVRVMSEVLRGLGAIVELDRNFNPPRMLIQAARLSSSSVMRTRR